MIKIGTLLHLEQREMTNDHKLYRCRVIDRIDAQTILVDYPIYQETGRQALLMDGTNFVASFQGDDNIPYEFSTTLTGRIRSHIPMLQLTDPGSKHYRRNQRRHFVRIDVNNEIEVSPTEDNFVAFKTMTHDISGGGCKLSIPFGVQFPKKGVCNLHTTLPLPTGQAVDLSLKGEIIRTEDIKELEQINASFKFIDISDEDRQYILQYCFHEQIRMKKKLQE